MAFQVDPTPTPVTTERTTNFDVLVRRLKAAADPTRLRLLALLSKSQLSVNEITQVTGHSQPTVSRSLKTLCDAGLLERSPEGSWVFYRVPDEGEGATLAQQLIASLPATDQTIAADEAALDNVRQRRTQAAAEYFRQNAAQWEELRSLHVSNEDVEQAMLELTSDQPIGKLLDIGTGTGRMLEILAPLTDRAVGLDISHEMLSIARANLSQAGLVRSSVRHGNLYQPPFALESFDFIVLHQVLHYLEDPGEALVQTSKLLQPSGRILIADFAPHGLEHLREDHEHRRLGIHGEELARWADHAGLSIDKERTLHPPPGQEESLTVRIWLLRQGPGPYGNWLKVV